VSGVVFVFYIEYFVDEDDDAKKKRWW